MSTRDDAGDVPESQKFSVSKTTALDGFLQVLAPHFDLIELGPLSKQASVELVRHMIAGEPPSDIDRIVEEAGGIPFFIAELAFYIQTVESTDGEPIRLHQALEARITSLPEAARELIELAAVAGAPISQRVAASALGGSSEMLARVIRHLRTAHLLRAPGGRATDRVECYHNRIREAVRRSLSPERRVVCHRALAIAFEQWSEGTAERMSRHWEGAGDARRAATYARRAADQAAATFDFSRAARLYEKTLALGEFADDDDREIRAAMAVVLDQAGRQAEAARAYVAAARGSDHARALQLRASSAVSLLRGGYIDKGMTAIEQVLGEMGIRLATTHRRAAISLTLRRLWLWLRGSWWRRRDVSDIPARKLTELDVCASITMALGMIDTVRGVEFQVRHLLMALRLGEPRRVAYALGADGAYLTARGMYGRANKILERAEKLANEVGDDAPLTVVAWARGAALFLRDSDFSMALPQFRAAEALLRRLNMGGSWEMVTVVHYIFSSRYFLGEIGALIEKIPQYVAAAERRGDVYAVVSMKSRFNLVWLASSGAPAAQQALSQARSGWGKGSGRFQLQHMWMFLAGVELALYQNKPQEAQQIVDRTRAAIRGSMLAGNPNLGFLVAYARARVAALVGDRTELCVSKKQLESGAPLARGLARVVDGWIAQLDGNSAAAIDHLRHAIEVLDSLSVNLYAFPARRALGALLGPGEGETLIRDADAWMATQGVADPESLARVLVPAIKRPESD
jgi:tetratricopeptide (TPR) repeat protein